MLNPNDVRRGKPIRGKLFRDLMAHLQSMRIITDPGSGLSSERTSSGTMVWLDEPPEIPIRITAKDAGKYAWNAVQATTAGTWDDMTQPAGTILKDWAVEINGQDASVPQIVLGRREEWTHRMTFSREICG